jgi:hypothetical protein
MHGWCRSNFAVTSGIPSNDKFMRLEIRDRLYKRYKTMAEQELGADAVSKDTFNKHTRHGFEVDIVEACCCGGCCDGWTAISMLHDFVSDAEYKFPDRKLLAKRVDNIDQFLRSDYRWKHLKESSHEAMHCMQHALGSSCAALCEGCDHSHVNTCVECNELPMLLAELTDHTHALAARRLDAISKDERSINGWEQWHKELDWVIHKEECMPPRMIHGSQTHTD